MLTNLEQAEFLDSQAEPETEGADGHGGLAGRPSATIGDAVRYCRTLGDALNASQFSLLFCASKGETKRLAPVFDHTFPGLSPLSRALSVPSADLSCANLHRSPTPAWWRRVGTPHFLTPAARRWAREVEAPTPDLNAIAFPVTVERDRSGVLVFAGEDMLIDEAALCETHARCHRVFADVARQRRQEGTATPSVSRREIECLRLTANGLTSEDIAASLGLSVHTANQYLTNSTHKLNAVNRIHAVAKALRCGLID